MEKITVLYVSVDPSMGGSTASLFYLIEGIKDKVIPVVLFPQYGQGYSYFTEHGIECYVCPFVELDKFRANRFWTVWKHPWRWHRIKKIKTDLRCSLYMKRVLKGRTVSIVHTNTSPNDVGIHLSRMLHAKHIWHVRECLDLHMNAEIYGGMPRLISKINHADARIAVSNFVASHWQMKSEASFVIHDAVRPADEIIYDSNKEKYILFSSYFITEEKGSRIAIEAFGKSKLSEEGFDLLLVGNCKDEHKRSLLKTASKYRCEQNVRFIPCQPDVKPFFVKASVLVMASKAEGFSRVVSEAFFFGCPVIASSESGGALDQVIDGETGFVFHSVEECASLLRFVCLNDNEPMIRRAMNYAKDELSTEKYAVRIKEVYEKVLSN